MTNLTGRVVIAQMNPEPANIRANLHWILFFIEEAKAKGADLVIFPELAVSGYLLGDRWENDAFIRELERANEHIRMASKDIAVIWGSVKADWEKIGEDGRVRKYNAAFVAQNGEWVSNSVLRGWIPKTNLPKYRIFDDARHFYPAANLARDMDLDLSYLLQPFFLMLGDDPTRVGLTVCEDLWEDEYSTKPSRIYGAHGVDLLIDISCSPWTADKWRARERMLRSRVMDSGVPIIYVNSFGLQNNGKNLVWFDGDSAIIDQSGNFVWRAPQHKGCIMPLDLSRLNEPLPERKSMGIKEIHDAIIASVREFFAPFKKVVIGLSGGIDSAVSAALIARAIGSHMVLAVNMPTEFNSATTKNLAQQCAENLKVEYKVVPIQGLYEVHLAMLASAGVKNPSTLVKENIQARIRGGSVQAALAAAHNGVFVCNGNKTEMALNYFTLYGDGAGAAAFLADLWKGQVYELARYLNETEGRELIPEGIMTIVPSAELSADQAVDEGKGDPIFFPYHDKLLRAFTEWRWDPTTVMIAALEGTLEGELGCEPGTITKYFKTPKEFVENLEWAWRQYSMEYKRVQTPPVLLTSRRAFGFDRRDTIADGYLTEEFFSYKDLLLDRELA
ncbi:MAG: NAD+ synthase [Parcubacteria bacterium C7867-001]|nr:MAG: NAD+ synthase [Parcubacteria bacterium C7867-001]